MSEPSRILLVEDNPIDVRAVKWAFKELGARHAIEVVHDGGQAIAHLSADDRHKPNLVLLDLNLPGHDGQDVLEFMKRHADLRRIPVVVLTTSANDADVVGAYDRGANAYVPKPIDLAGWQHAVALIASFWLALARLPPT